MDGNAFAVEPTLHQSRVRCARPTATGACAACTTSAAGRIPGAGIPGVLLGAEVTAGLVAADHPAGGPCCRRLSDRCSPRPATTTRRVARTFALACRLLPRDVRDDVYLPLPRLPHARRPRRRAAPRTPRERVAAVEAWCDGERGDARREARAARRPRRAPRAAARRAARLLRRHARRPRRRRRSSPRPSSTATATAWPGPSAS